MTEKIIFGLGNQVIKKHMKSKWNSAFYKDYKKAAKSVFKQIYPFMPKLRRSAFKFNFAFTPAYIAWYKALKQLNVEHETIIGTIYTINEKLILLIPKFIRKHFGSKIYLGSFRKKANKHIKLYEVGKLHKMDYKIAYKELGKDSFEIDFFECPMQIFCIRLGAPELLPAICRIDYLVSNLLYCGFTRTKTLGDGNDCCNCQYNMKEYCEWSPEKGFETRK